MKGFARREFQPARLAPWSCVVGDVLAAYPGAQEIDPEVASRWLVRVDGFDLWFVYGLLQTVRAAGVSSRRPDEPT